LQAPRASSQGLPPACPARESAGGAATVAAAGAGGTLQGGAAGAAGAGAQAGAAGGDQPQQNITSKQIIALAFVKKLQDSGMLKAEVMLDRFFGVLTDLAVEEYATQVMLYERTLPAEQRHAQAAAAPEIARGQVHPPPARVPTDGKYFQAVDAFSDLVVVLIKCCAWSSTKRDETSSRQGAAECALITRVLHVVAKALQFNHDWSINRASMELEFPQPALPEGSCLQEHHQQQPYMRFLSNLMIALSQSTTDDQRLEFFVIIANTLHVLNPQRLPGFAFAWIELIGHRLFIAKLMKNQDGWPLYFKLINDALRFVEPFARPNEMTPPLILYFKCILKLMLLLLHDFSEFLLAFHQPLCDAIPPCCIQLRNIVLSAFPRATKLPDPFSRSGKYNQLPELRDAPAMVPQAKNPFDQKFMGITMPLSKDEFDNYIATKQPADYPARLASVVMLNNASGTHHGGVSATYNVPMLSSIVLYTCIATLARNEAQIRAAMEDAKQRNTTVDPDALTFNAEMPAAEILRSLLERFNSEGRYHVINACVNQLRFPNAHTHFFSLALQHLFAHPCPHQEHVQEGITRVLVERLIISRPHPWGLLITFFDIVKDRSNGFWEKPFIRCTPEIERMFESVAQSVHPPQQAAPAAAPGQTAAPQQPGAPQSVGAPQQQVAQPQSTPPLASQTIAAQRR
jgi:CCR4-NOT transcription complex subunit 1